MSSLAKTAVGTATLVTKTTALLGAGVFAGVTASFVKFEDAFAGVRKTVEASEPEFRAIERALRDLATQIPVNVSVLSDLARLAGQFGIQAADISEFTRVLALLSATIDDLPVEEAASGLARIATILQVAREDFSRLGAVLTDLGNKFASSEGAILDLAQRIAGASKVINIAAASVFGIANAFATVVGPQGVEAAGTAIQKVMLAINRATLEGGENLAKFAEVAGLSVEEFQALFERDPTEAFVRFVEGIGRAGREGELILRDLGLADARLIRSFLQVAGAGDLLRRSVSTANTAFAENTALVNEANKRFQTLLSQLRLLKNRLNEVGISLGEMIRPGLIESIDRLSGALSRIQEVLGPAFRDLNQSLPSIASGLADVLVGVTRLVGAFLTLFAAFGDQGIPAIGEFINGVGQLIGLLARILAPALEAIGRGLRDIVSLASTEFGGVVDEVAKAFGTIAEGIASAMTDIVRAFRGSLPLLAGLLVELSQSVGRFAKAIGPDLAVFIVEFVERMSQLLTALVNVLEVIGGPLLRVFGAVFDLVGDVVIEVSRIIRDTLGESFNQLADALVTIIQALGPELISLFRNIASIVVTITPSLLGLLKAIADGIPQILEAFGPLLEVLPEALTTLIDGFTRILGPILRIGNAFLRALAPVLKTIVPLVVDLAVSLADMFAAIAPELFEKLAQAIVIAAPAAAELVNAIAAGLVIALQGLAPVLPTIASVLALLASSLAQLAPLIGTLLAQAFLTLIPPLAEIARTLIPLALSFLQQLGRVLSEAVIPFLGEFLKALSNLLVQVAPFLPPLFKALADALILIIQALVPLLPLLVQLLAPVLVTLLQIVTPLVPIFAELVTTVFKAFLEILQPLIPHIVELVKNFAVLLSIILPPLLTILKLVVEQGIATLQPALLIALGTFKFFNFFIEHVTIPVLKFLLETFLDIVGGILSAGATVAEFLPGHFGDGLIEAQKKFESFRRDMERTGADITNSLNSGLGSRSSLIQGSVGDLTRFFDPLQQIPGRVETAFGSTLPQFEGLNGAVQTAIGDTSLTLRDAGGNLVGGLSTGASDFLKSSQWGELWTGVAPNSADLLARGAGAPIGQPSPLTGPIGSGLMSGVAEGAQNQLIATLNRLIAALEEMLTRLDREGSQRSQRVGVNLLSGIQEGALRIIRGAGSTWSRFWQGVGGGIVDLINFGARIFSPSQLTMESGRNIAEGLIQGFEESASSVRNRFVESTKNILAPEQLTAGLGISVGEEYAEGLISALQARQVEITKLISNLLETDGVGFPGLPQPQDIALSVQPGRGQGATVVGAAGPLVGTLNVNEVSADPRATAEAVTTRIAQEVRT